MGNIVIRGVKYSGDRYYYDSPSLRKGINILEGENGMGKSTFMNFIYYTFGGSVFEFENSEIGSHKQIKSDSNNFIELLIELNDKEYTLKRYIKGTDILVTGEKEDLLLQVNRSPNSDRQTFSDWFLKALDIDVIDIFMGNREWKINIKDLMRLIYYNQAPDPSGIYKKPDYDNFITESELVRKIIFQILLGKIFNDYYKCISEERKLENKKNVSKSILDEYSKVIYEINIDRKDLNLVFLNKEFSDKTTQLNTLINMRDSYKKVEYTNPDNASKINDLKAEYLNNEIKIGTMKTDEYNILKELNNFNRLKEDVILEVTQIRKIIHSHEKLKLFSADTCPYCLNIVDRKTGHCVCGSKIEEEQYERFFYSSDEYWDIMRTKQKSVETIDTAIHIKLDEYNQKKKEIEEFAQNNVNINKKIQELISDLDSKIDVNRLDEINDKILDLKNEINTISQQIEVERKREAYEKHYKSIIDELAVIKNKSHFLEAKANDEIHQIIVHFNSKFNELMRNTLEDCRSANIRYEDYMPVINEGEYKESSSLVSIRLMYYFTILFLSLTFKDIKFPRFLMIDTPETAGIDQIKLINTIAQIKNIVPKGEEQNYQIILTTGIDKYPEEYKNFVFETLTKSNRLLKKRENQTTN